VKLRVCGTNAQLFQPHRYRPEPFCYAIRRPDHYPDGTLSIESQGDGDTPIMTLTRKLESAKNGADSGTMHFPINAATNVEFKGDRYLHAWVAHEFDREGGGGSMVSATVHLALLAPHGPHGPCEAPQHSTSPAAAAAV
jgi:hypothetical protein